MRLTVSRAVIGTVLFVLAVANAQSEAGLRIYEKNPRYLSYDGTPIFMASKSFWNNAISSPDSEYIRDIEIMAAHGGNLLRQNTFWPSHGESGGHLPWVRDPDTGLYDLDSFNPAYFERLRAYMALAEKHQAVVSLEMFCHPSVKGGSGRWPAHPMNPAKNINYEDAVFGTSSGDSVFFRTLPEHDDNRVALHYQQAFARKVVEETIEFRNIIYSMGNECPSPEAWNAYWSAFLKGVAAESGRELLVTNMWRQDLPAFDVFDLQDAQNPFRVRRAGAAAMWRAFQALDAWQREHDRIKPVYDSGQMGGGPGSHILHQLWMSFVGGTAGMRYHRAAPVHPRPGVSSEVVVGDYADPRYLEQHRWIQNLRSIIHGMEFWTMDPLWDAVREGEGYGLGRAGDEYVFYLPAGGAITAAVAGGAGHYRAHWHNADTGATNAPWDLDVPADAETFRATAPEGRDWVLHLRARS
jgi:hypothetical protein